MKHARPDTVPITARIAATLIRLRRTDRRQFETLPPALKIALGDYEANERQRAMMEISRIFRPLKNDEKEHNQSRT
jgi:hypothetical protein